MADQSFSAPVTRPGPDARRHLHLAPPHAAAGVVPHVIRLSGDVDIQTRPLLAHEVDGFVESGSCTVVVDLADVDFLDSTGLQLFLRLRAVAEERGGSVRLRSADHRVLRILEVTGVTPLFVLEA